MDLMVSTLNIINTTTSAGLQPYKFEDRRFFFLIYIISQEAIKE